MLSISTDVGCLVITLSVQLYVHCSIYEAAANGSSALADLLVHERDVPPTFRLNLLLVYMGEVELYHIIHVGTSRCGPSVNKIHPVVKY